MLVRTGFSSDVTRPHRSPPIFAYIPAPTIGERPVRIWHCNIDAEAAGGCALVGRERGISGDHVDRSERHIEFLDDHLSERGGAACLT